MFPRGFSHTHTRPAVFQLQLEIQAVEAKQLLVDNFKQREDMRRLEELRKQQEEVRLWHHSLKTITLHTDRLYNVFQK